MTHLVNRRQALSTCVSSTAGLTLASSFAKAATSANRKVVIGIMGMSRGLDLAEIFAKVDNVEIKYVCDVDTQRAEKAKEQLSKENGISTEAISDFRRILDDKSVDALVCAAPNHWHAAATIMACAAGKHVYVEKPCSHNPAEGELMIQAARTHHRVVQMGTQRRSSPAIVELMQKLHEGIIGRVYSARAFYFKSRTSIGKGKQTKIPPHLDYELWQGPAPRRPYFDNVIHYNWHWRWHWGNGGLGNNGCHGLDVCRWGLQVDYPTRVVSSGNRYRFDDDQETPDTQSVALEFGDKGQIIWQGISNNRHPLPYNMFFGEKGAVELDTVGNYTIWDANEKQIEKVRTKGLWGKPEHAENFIEAVRNDDFRMLNQEIESGHKSTMLCHLGNIAHRTGRTIQCDPVNGHIIGDHAAMAQYWSREYQPGWEPTI